MKFKRLKQTPVIVAACVLALICIARIFHFDLDSLELRSLDQRIRVAQHFNSDVATNLGFVFIDDNSARAVASGEVGFHFGLYWPRQVYARLVNELALQHARLIAFDVLFGELREDHPTVQLQNGEFLHSDEVFGRELHRARNVILATTPELHPPPLFATNALALGDISTDKDPDGILRRARVFRIYTNWHPEFLKVEADPDMGIDLSRARIEPGKIILPRSNGEEIAVPVDGENNFSLADFKEVPPGEPPKAKAFTEERVWHMGVVLAAKELHLDLAHADVDLKRGRIALRGEGGVERVIPVDRDGYFYIDWALRPNDPRLTIEPIHSLLLQNYLRLQGFNEAPRVDWTNKLVIVGSAAQGNELTDRGATPLSKDTLLVSKHWNVANSILMNRFIRRASLGTELLLIVVLGAITALLTWQLRAVTASVSVIVLALLYCALGFFLFIKFRYWLPLVMPVACAIAVQHVCLVVYRVMFEEREQRRVKSIFSKVVAPDVVKVLLGAERLSLGGARREVTVLFADVRGFTELTDSTQAMVSEYVSKRNLPPDVAEKCHDEFAKETLGTVNAYLTCVIDAALKENGTFDKLIGDCVMFFWGAPVDHAQHASAAVRAAVQAQRAIYKLNQQRAIENKQREIENRARESAGLPPKPPLALLSLGTGINTGMVTAGIMGWDDRQVNFTVFGREVNLASRLEGISGRGRIFISETTFAHLKRDDSTLAATCIEREPVTPKGFTKPVRIFEVPWLPQGETPPDYQTKAFTKSAETKAQS